MTKLTPTEEQAKIIASAATDTVIKISALAGSGKTTVLEMIAKAYPEKRYRYLVFNRKMQKKAQPKMKKLGVSAQTGNSIAWNFVLELYKEFGLDMWSRFRGESGQIVSNKEIAAYFDIRSYEIVETRKVRDRSTGRYELQDQLVKLTPSQVVAHLKKAITKFCISEDDELDISHFPANISYPPEASADARKLWLDLFSPYGVQKITYDATVKIWALSRPDLRVAEDDPTKPYDGIMVDEAQDTNPVFARVYRDQECQRIYVGDTNQAIYGFRGAHDELERVKADAELLLTKTWRFGPELTAAPNAFLKALGSKNLIVSGKESPGIVVPSGTMMDPDVVICRTNSGVLRAIFEKLDAGILVLVPSDYVKTLTNLVETIAWFYGYEHNKPSQIHPDLESYASKAEIEEAIEEGDLTGKVLSVLELIKNQGHKNLLSTLSLVNANPKKGVKGVSIITAHASKGLEWDRVQIYDDFWGYKYNYLEGKYELPNYEELNLAYVAVSRAMEEIDLGSLDYILRPAPTAEDYFEGRQNINNQIEAPRKALSA
jgi:superfamily I DNA/RNA helicase